MNIGHIFFLVVAAGFSIRVHAAPQPLNLTPATFDRIKARLTLGEAELAWQKIHWRDGFFEGVLEAQVADKPLFYWIYEGDPRGYS